MNTSSEIFLSVLLFIALGNLIIASLFWRKHQKYISKFTKEYHDAFGEGYIAYYLNTRTRNNPYKIYQDKYEAWNEGYDEASRIP